MNEKYMNAFNEVYQIINLLDESLYNKIPTKIVKKFESIAKKSNYDKVILPYIPLEKQDILQESKVLLKYINMYL